MDTSHKTFEIETPKGVSASELQIVAEFCNQRGLSNGTPIVLQEAKAKKPRVKQPQMDIPIKDEVSNEVIDE